MNNDIRLIAILRDLLRLAEESEMKIEWEWGASRTREEMNLAGAAGWPEEILAARAIFESLR